MKTSRTWQGVRMRRISAAADPDSAPREVTIPAAWDETAAAALVALAPEAGQVELPRAAESWIRPIAEQCRRTEQDNSLPERLRSLLLLRRGCPTSPVWLGRADETP